MKLLYTAVLATSLVGLTACNKTEPPPSSTPAGLSLIHI